MTPQRRSGADQATLRGIIVLFVAVVIGVALLSRSDTIIGSASSNSSRPDSTTTSAPATTDSQPPGTGAPINTGDVPSQDARPPEEVKVIVVNAAGGIAGVGRSNSDLLTGAGYQVIDIKNAPAVPNTVITYAEGFLADAEAVKAAIKVPTAQIAPNPATPIVPEAAEANVVVVIGQDYQAPA